MDMTSEIGITTACDCGDSLEETLHNIKSAGFSNVMLDRYQDLDTDIDTTKKLGLNVAAVHLDGRLSNNLWEKGEVADQFVKRVMREIEILAKHGIDVGVMHHADSRDTLVGAKAPTEQALKNFRRIIEQAEKFKVKIALENIDPANMNHLFYLLDNVKSNYLGFCYDSGHHNLFDSKLDLLGKYGKKLEAVHLHDNYMNYSPEKGWSGDLHLLPFDGKIDFDKVAQNIAQSSYKGVTMLETSRGAKIRKTYDQLTPEEYLKKAFERGKRLSKLIISNRKDTENTLSRG